MKLLQQFTLMAVFLFCVNNVLAQTETKNQFSGVMQLYSQGSTKPL